MKPYDSSSKVDYDLWGNNLGNQAQPLFLSCKGRYVWSEEPIKYAFDKGTITVAVFTTSFVSDMIFEP